MKHLALLGLMFLLLFNISIRWNLIKGAEAGLSYTPNVHEFKQFNTVCFSHGKSAISCVKVKRGDNP